jgi:hypothetical protein
MSTKSPFGDRGQQKDDINKGQSGSNREPELTETD